ncbi:MAG TPA: PHB depolymerase family esterase [Thermoanaerobaculia bacterium]|nr:PHB depolymerase family esterase [Thermoanaerobaculia bacterium]
MKTVALILTLPALLAVTEAASFYARNRNNGKIVSSGERREYLLYVPPHLDRTKPAVLVMSLHPAGGWPALQRDVSRWNELASREGFIVVYPAGRETAGPRIWHMEGDRDTRYIADLIEKLSAEYNIDPKRIYANGFSNGGGMSFALSCRMPDRFAAIGIVGAALLLPSTWCRSARPMPMIGIHGLRDRAAPYRGGPSWLAPHFESFLAFGDGWARRNRCARQPQDVEIRDGVLRREYQQCANDATVALYTLRDGGHTWPGGLELPEWFVGKTINDFDATAEMWRFFEQHRRR